MGPTVPNILKNVGSMENKGLELGLNTQNKQIYHKQQTFKFVLTLSKIQWFIYDF